MPSSTLDIRHGGAPYCRPEQLSSAAELENDLLRRFVAVQQQQRDQPSITTFVPIFVTP
jgi:hypothetical protein